MSEQDAVVAPRALPPPAIDPDDLIALIPGLSPEDAERYCSLATLAVQAAIWPNELPPAPLPPPLYATVLTVAARLAGSAAPGVGQVVSESIGSYSYHLANPPTLDAALGLTDSELDALEPWMARKTLFQLDVAGSSPYGWPVDWWQRDYDNWWPNRT